MESDGGREEEGRGEDQGGGSWKGRWVSITTADSASTSSAAPHSMSKLGKIKI